MSEIILQKLLADQQSMTRRAMRLVLIIAFCIHILLNVFEYNNRDPILKVEMPILSGVTFLRIFIGMRVFKHE